MPYLSNKSNWQEFINEFCILLVACLLFPLTDQCSSTVVKSRVSLTIIILIFTQVIGNLSLILFEVISAIKKRIVDCRDKSKKLAKGISSDKYEIGEAAISGDSKSMTEIELKQLRLSTPADESNERGYKGGNTEGLTKSIHEFMMKEESKKGKGDSGEFLELGKSD